MRPLTGAEGKLCRHSAVLLTHSFPSSSGAGMVCSDLAMRTCSLRGVSMFFTWIMSNRLCQWGSWALGPASPLHYPPLGSGGELTQMLGDFTELLTATCLACLTWVLALSPHLGPGLRAVWRDSCPPTSLSPYWHDALVLNEVFSCLPFEGLTVADDM